MASTQPPPAIIKERKQPPLALDPEVPSNVYTLSLNRLSQFANIPESELIRGMQSHDAVEMQGIVVNPGQAVPFEAVGRTPISQNQSQSSTTTTTTTTTNQQPAAFGTMSSSVSGSTNSSSSPNKPFVRVKEVLITAASSTMCLENSDTPKCLIKLGEYTMIEHILAQLFVAGIERVVIIISYFGHEIMDHVKNSFLFPKMRIEFLNLGEETPYGHARTLLSAREMFTKPFLIHTADHIFDKNIICRLANFDLQDSVACVLVETDQQQMRGLPATAGKILLGDNNNILRIGRGLLKFDAIDAGLFLTTGRIFAALEMLAYEKPKFSLAEALNVLRPSYGLKYLKTEGEIWLSIETQAQFDRIMTQDLISLLSPWPVFVARDKSLASTSSADAKVGRSVLLAVSASDDDSTLRAADTHDTAAVFDGFVVGVNQLQQVPMEEETISEGTPLLNVRLSPRSRITVLSPHHKIVRKKSSFLETAEDSFVVSIPFELPLEPDTINSAAAAAAGSATANSPMLSSPRVKERKAYLIQFPQDGGPTRRPPEMHQFVLAVPEPMHRRSEGFELTNLVLPSDVKDVAVETLESRDGKLAMQLLVKRQAPLAAYLLLVVAWLVIASAPFFAPDPEVDVDPFVKFFWRCTGSFVVMCPFALFALVRDGFPDVSPILFLMSCFGYAFFVMSYLWSLNKTSPDHAYFFNNCHSLFLTMGKLVLGYTVPALEGVGTGLSILGGILTALDEVSSSSEFVADATMSGDIVALLGAFGGVIFLVGAKRLRVAMDPAVFLAGLFLMVCFLVFPVYLYLQVPVEWSTDPRVGLFGWVHSSHLMNEVVLVGLSMLGMMNYVGAMKYFDPIVVSVGMLLEPVLEQMLGLVWSMETVPGVLTIIGAVLIVVGILVVLVSNAKRTESIDATDAIEKSFLTPKYFSKPMGSAAATSQGQPAQTSSDRTDANVQVL